MSMLIEALLKSGDHVRFTHCLYEVSTEVRKLR